MWRAWSENCAKNPENLRGQDFAKSEDMRGQTRSFGAQTVSSHVFNAKSCPLRFSRNLRKASDQARHIHARRRRKGKHYLNVVSLSSPPSVLAKSGYLRFFRFRTRFPGSLGEAAHGAARSHKFTLSTPPDIYSSMSHSQVFQTQGDTPPHKANAIP